MSFTDSEAIIWIVERAADALQIVSDILDTTAGQVGVFGTIAALGVTIVGNKMQEHAYAKEQQRIDKERALADTQKEKADAQARIQKAKDAITQAQIDSKTRIDKLEADGKAQVNALGEKRIQLEKLKVQAQQTREKHVQAVTDAEANISQLELNKKLQEELIKEKEKTKEDLLQLALQKEAEGDKAASDKLLSQASDAEKE